MRDICFNKNGSTVQKEVLFDLMMKKKKGKKKKKNLKRKNSKNKN
jgi:hypothetical protein